MQITIQPLSRPINGIITLPGSKSYTNRALIMAALYKGKSNIKNYSESNDSLTMIKALNQLGIKIVKHNNQLAIFGNGSQFIPFYKTVNINVGDAGTAMRFLTAFCTLMPGEIILDGSDRMRQRPIGDLVEALKKIGAEIIYLKKIGCPPLKITGGKIQGGLTEIKGSISSQFISALLMVGPVLQKGLQLKIIGSLISRSYIDMTIDSLKHFGVRVANKNNQMFIVKPNEQYQSGDYVVEGDVSGSSYFWGIAAVTGSKIRVTNINFQSVQGDIQFPKLLEKMGCQVKQSVKNQQIEVKGPKHLKAINVDMSLMPDTAQTLAVVAAFANGQAKITGLSTLKVKETDRLMALKIELNKMGIKSEITNDSITIHGGKPHGAIIKTYNDHRMAMVFAIAGSIIKGIKIKNPEVVNKSLPKFWEKLSSLGIKNKIL